MCPKMGLDELPVKNEHFETIIEIQMEPDFDWICGLCKAMDKRKFPTLLQLFDHKKVFHGRGHYEPEEVWLDYSRLSVVDPENPTVIQPAKKQPGDDEDDIPLARLKSKHIKNKIKIPKKRPIKKLVKDEEKIPKRQRRKVEELPKDEEKNRKRRRRKKKLVEEKMPEAVKEKEPQTTQKEIKTDLGSEFALLVEEAVEGLAAEELIDWQNAQKTLKLPRYFCRVCYDSFQTKQLLSDHKNLHKHPGTDEYMCGTCKKIFKKFDNYARHCPIHEEDRPRPYFCDFCGSNFFTINDLKRHMNLHLDVKPYMCLYCNAGFVRQDALLSHVAKHTGVPYEKFTCKVCLKVLNSPSALSMHSKNHTEKSLFCQQPGCKFSCYLMSQLKQHTRTHNGEKPHQCPTCGRCFGRSNDMKNHILNVHERFRPFKCQDCPKEFTLMSALKAHQAMHINVRPYLCDECGKRFSLQSSLRKHVQCVHGGVKRKSKVKDEKKFIDATVQCDPVEGPDEAQILTINLPMPMPVPVEMHHSFLRDCDSNIPTISIPSPMDTQGMKKPSSTYRYPEYSRGWGIEKFS